MERPHFLHILNFLKLGHGALIYFDNHKSLRGASKTLSLLVKYNEIIPDTG
jgi:hypothetical protein